MAGKTIANATMERLVHHAHGLELQGESMRKKRENLTNDFLIEKI
jgi:DNA replication protein DnaC